MLNVDFQSFLNMENRFQSWHKVTNNASIDITLMSLLQYLGTFLSTSTLCTWSVRSNRPGEFYKKGVLKYSQKIPGKHVRWVSFAIKLQTGGTGAFLCVFAKSFRRSILQTSVRVCLWRVKSLQEFLSVKF